jgi:photosystem II stability/assembly factor-like uncharacterized protein
MEGENVKNRSYVYILEVVTSLLLVGGLFYAGFFVTPVVHVKKIEKFPFERRDALYSAVTLDNKGESFCIVGSYGKILRTQDGGSTWAIQKTPNQAHLQKVVAWDKDTLMAIGDNATVLTTGDAGQSWKAVKVPTYERGDVFLTAHLEPESGRVWIAGNMGMVLFSDDKGATWNMTHPQEDISWNSIAVTKGQNVWLVGEAGKVQHSRDNGKSWEKVSVQTEASLNAIAFSDDNHAVIVGLSGTILATSDGGKSWQPAVSGVQTHLYGLLWDGKSYSAVGDAGMLLTADAQGTKWQVGKLEANNFGWYTAISRVGEAYIVSGAGAGLYSKGNWFPFVPGQVDYKKLKGGGNNG